MTLSDMRKCSVFLTGISERVGALHQEAHAEIGEHDYAKARDAEDRGGTARPRRPQSCMEIEAVKEPEDACPEFLGSPEPVCPPCEIRPYTAEYHRQREEAIAEQDRAILISLEERVPVSHVLDTKHCRESEERVGEESQDDMKLEPDHFEHRRQGRALRSCDECESGQGCGQDR